MATPFRIAWVVALLAVSACSSRPPRQDQTESSPIKDVISDQTAGDFATVAAATRRLIARHGKEHVLVLYDIDNTLLAMSTPLGSDQWFDWQAGPDAGTERIHNGTDIGCLLEAQDLLYFLRPMRLTDASRVQATLADVRDQGATQWALTSRGPDFAGHTARELARFDLDFSPFEQKDGGIAADATFPAFDEASKSRVFSTNEISNPDFKLGKSADPVRLQDGVYYTGGQHKGTMLRLLLDRLQQTEQFKGIVFIDDKAKNVTNVEMALKQGPIDYVLIRYSHEDTAVNDFKSATAHSAATRDWCNVIADVPTLIRGVDPAVLNLTVSKGADIGKDLATCAVDICPD